MDRTRWHLPVYHDQVPAAEVPLRSNEINRASDVPVVPSSHIDSAHESHRCLGVAWFFGLPLPWLTRRCRTCSHEWPCPTTVRAQMAAGILPGWMTPTLAAALSNERAEVARLAHLQGRRP